MNLRDRLRRLEGTTEQQQCPEHELQVDPPLPIDWRAALAPFSPDPAERAASRAVAERQAEPQAKAKREKAERKLSAAQVLGGRVDRVRRGGVEGLMQRMQASGRYGRL
jgi:hypothetical protein